MKLILTSVFALLSTHLLAFGGRGESHYYGEQTDATEIIPQELGDTLPVLEQEESNKGSISVNTETNYKQRIATRSKTITSLQEEIAEVSASIVKTRKKYRTAGYSLNKLTNKSKNDGLSARARALKKKYWDLKRLKKALQIELGHMRSHLITE